MTLSTFSWRAAHKKEFKDLTALEYFVINCYFLYYRIFLSLVATKLYTKNIKNLTGFFKFQQRADSFVNNLRLFIWKTILRVIEIIRPLFSWRYLSLKINEPAVGYKVETGNCIEQFVCIIGISRQCELNNVYIFKTNT